MKTRSTCLRAVICVAICTVVCAMIPVSSFAGTASSWSATPDPTGTPTCFPNPTVLQLDVTFTVDQLSDKDTLTTISSSGGSCTSASKEWPDRIDGDWLIGQPGVLTLDVYSGCSVDVPAEAWTWSSNSGDTGASVDISGLFTFDDRRLRTDPAHDSKSLGGTSGKIIIPDSITSSILSEYYYEYDPNIHMGSIYEEHIINEDYPTVPCVGYRIREEIPINFFAFDVREDPEVRDQIIRRRK